MTRPIDIRPLADGATSGDTPARSWSVGDLFLVPQSDGGHTVAQILAHELAAMNSAICAFTLRRAQPGEAVGPIEPSEIIAVQYVTIELLDSGEWPVAGTRPPVVAETELELADKRANHFAGTKICGSGVITSLLNACFGLEPWDDWNDPEQLDKLLTDPRHKPALVVYKDEGPVN